MTIPLLHRLVPPQTPRNILPLVEAHVESEFSRLGTKCKYNLEELGDGKPWLTDLNHWNFQAGKAATKVDIQFLLFKLFNSAGCLQQGSQYDERRRLHSSYTYLCRSPWGQRNTASYGTWR